MRNVYLSGLIIVGLVFITHINDRFSVMGPSLYGLEIDPLVEQTQGAANVSGEEEKLAERDKPSITKIETVNIFAPPWIAAVKKKQLSDEIFDPAWQRYSVGVPLAGDTPVIALVLDDMGMDPLNSDRVFKLPGPLTLAFLAYAPNLQEQTSAASDQGHEIIMHVPMEPMSELQDPGPNALLVGQDGSEISRRLVRMLDQTSGFVGINNHMGSRFTSNERGMKIVMAELARRGLAFLDSRTTSESVAESVARQFMVPIASRDIFIDNSQDGSLIEFQLNRLEKLAILRGYSVGIGHPRLVTLEILESWLLTIEARGFRLVPISAIWLRNYN